VQVRIRGYLSKHSSTVGIGPGATVTFHRVLLIQFVPFLSSIFSLNATSVLLLVWLQQKVIFACMKNCSFTSNLMYDLYLTRKLVSDTCCGKIGNLNRMSCCSNPNRLACILHVRSDTP
jgi:hypothetical protein